jgi:hypothetical protein
MVSNKAYLYLSRHNIYYFRVIVALGVLGSITKYEYRKSLQTRDINSLLRKCPSKHYHLKLSKLLIKDNI